MAGGFTIPQIIDLANRRTDKRGEKKLDLNSEFLLCLVEFCQEDRWPWRKPSLTFNTVAGQAEYDFNDLSAYQNLAVERFPKDGVKRVIAPGDYALLDPIFDTEQQENAFEDTTQDVPGGYFLVGGSWSVLRLVPTPDAVYKIRTTAWMFPNLAPDALTDEVPLVPPFLHPLLVKFLEARILAYTEPRKYPAAMAEYRAGLTRAQLNTDFAEGQQKDWGRMPEGDAIQS